jgi:hypothetical protein
VNWLNTPCTDPTGRVFERDGRYYRAVYRARVAAVRELFSKGVVQRLGDRGLLAPMHVADLELEGHELVLETAASPFDVPCDRFSRGALHLAALCWIDAALELCESGYWLCDAHFGNFMLFGANRPLLIDIGSLQRLRDVAAERPFPSFTALCVNLIAPLLALYRQPALARAARLAIADQPYNGPVFPTDDGPFELRAVSTHHSVAAISRSISLNQAQGAKEALLRLRCFVEDLPGPRVDETPLPLPTSPLGGELQQRVREAAPGRVLCIGVDAYLACCDALRERSSLVIEEQQPVLDAFDHSLRSGRAGDRVSVYYGTLINRQFPAAPLRSELVLGLDVFTRLHHPSAVMFENIAAVIASIAHREALLCCAKSALGPATAALEQSFARVTATPAAAAEAPGERRFLLRCEART